MPNRAAELNLRRTVDDETRRVIVIGLPAEHRREPARRVLAPNKRRPPDEAGGRLRGRVTTSRGLPQECVRDGDAVSAVVRTGGRNGAGGVGVATRVEVCVLGRPDRHHRPSVTRFVSSYGVRSAIAGATVPVATTDTVPRPAR
jgi:hypothetical protein